MSPILLVVVAAWVLVVVIAASVDWWGLLAQQTEPAPLPDTVDTTLPEDEVAA